MSAESCRSRTPAWMVLPRPTSSAISSRRRACRSIARAGSIWKGSSRMPAPAAVARLPKRPVWRSSRLTCHSHRRWLRTLICAVRVDDRNLSNGVSSVRAAPTLARPQPVSRTVSQSVCRVTPATIHSSPRTVARVPGVIDSVRVGVSTPAVRQRRCLSGPLSALPAQVADARAVNDGAEWRGATAGESQCASSVTPPLEWYAGRAYLSASRGVRPALDGTRSPALAP